MGGVEMNRLPCPSDYGLPEDIEEAYRIEERKYKENFKQIYRERHRKLYTKVLSITFFVCIVLCVLTNSDDSIVELLGMSLACTFGSTGWFIALDWFFGGDSKDYRRLFWDSDFYKNYQKYKHDVREYNRQQLAKTQAFWLKQTGHQFELEVAKVYQAYGFNTAISKAGGDGGIDIVLTKGDEAIAVQCKHHSKPVAPAIVRDLYGTMIANGFSKGILVSLNGFTKGTKDFANGKPIELVDIDDLIRMSKK